MNCPYGHMSFPGLLVKWRGVWLYAPTTPTTACLVYGGRSKPRPYETLMCL